MASQRDDYPPKQLWHYTCGHGSACLGERGTLLPMGVLFPAPNHLSLLPSSASAIPDELRARRKATP